MFEGMRHQCIMFPADARDQIVPALERAGVECEPSTGRHTKKFQDTADVYLCHWGGGSAEIVIVRSESLPADLQGLVAVLISPSVGFFAQWRHGKANTALRDRIADIVFSIKATAESAPETQPGG